MGGIKCYKCGAIVSSAAEKTRLAADGVKWGVDKTIDTIRAINPNISITIDAAAGFCPAAVTSAPGKINMICCKAFNNETNAHFYREWSTCGAIQRTRIQMY
jgi:hypothetical protein